MQVFKGVDYKIDILNHQNVEFWSTMMPSYNTTGFISCAGTNFAIKAKALRHLGEFHCEAVLNPDFQSIASDHPMIWLWGHLSM